MEAVKNEFKSAASPIARLIGHSLAVALGFVVFAVVSALPLLVVRLLISMGMSDLASALHSIEYLIFALDVGIFVVVLLTGVVVFVVETLATTRNKVIHAWSKTNGSEI